MPLSTGAYAGGATAGVCASNDRRLAATADVSSAVNADAAMVITLEPGAYTALVTSAAGGTASGQCLIEIYEVK